MADSILYYKFSNTDKSLTGNFSFNQAAADDQQVTLAEGLNISANYSGQPYTQADDSLALLFTNSLGEIANQGLGLQFVTNAFTVNAEVFFDANSDQIITYIPIYAPTDLVFNTIYNFSNTDQTLIGNFSFNKAVADDQQVTLAEGLNISANYSGQPYTQADDSLALLFTNTLGEIADQGLGLQFVTNAFTVNADVFFDANTDQTITYTLAQAPTNSALSAISVNENIASGTVINSFSTVDQDSGTFTYTLVSGTGDIDNGAFTIDGNNLKINSSPDFETKSTYNIRVKTIDQDGLSFEKPLTVTINDLNEAPTDLVFNKIYNFSNADKTLTGSVSFNQATANDQQVTIAEGLKISLTYAGQTYTEADDSLAVLFTNQLGAISEQGLGLQFVTNAFTINADNFIDQNSVQTINYVLVETPTNLALSATNVNENVAAETVIGSFSTTDQDQNDIFIYSLVSGIGDTDNGAFTIDGNNLKINSSPDFETKSVYNIRVRTSDKGGLFLEKTLTITVNEFNETPTNLALSATNVNENVAAETVIGSFSTTDQDQNDIFIYSLVSGIGDTDNGAFTIDGNNLKINSSPDFETKSVYNIRVRTSDKGGLFLEKTLTITVNEFNETPTNLALSATNVNENVAAETVIGSFSTTDQDQNDVFIYSLVSGIGDTDNGAFTIDGNNLKINSSPDFETKSTYNIRVKTIDQDGLSFEKPLTVTINDLNEAPTDLVFNKIYNFSNADKTLTGSVSFNQATANDQQVTIAEGLKISLTYAGQTYTEADDSLAVLFTNQLGAISEQGLGLQFVTNAFTINADNFIDQNSVQTINYVLVETPTNLALSAISVNENVAAETVIGSFITTDQDQNDIFIYSLVSGIGDTDNGAFTIDGNNLKINSSPDFETKSVYNIRVRTSDKGGLFLEKTLTITVNEFNETPTNLALSATNVNENVAAETVIGSFSTTDQDQNDIFIYSLVSGIGDTDNGAFTIDGNNLKINSSPDFETKSVYNIRVRTSDKGGLFLEKILTITVNDLNETPTNLALSTTNVNENVAAETVIGSFSTTDQDQNDIFIYSLVSGIGDTDNGAFTIDGNNLKINSSPDFETKSVYNIRVRTSDKGGLFLEKTLTITVNEFNETPTNLALSATNVNENVAAETVIGSFITTDQDQNDIFIYSLVSGIGDTDNGAFTIDGNNLKINSSPDFETKSVYNIRVRTSDKGGLFVEKLLTIQVNNIDIPTKLTKITDNDIFAINGDSAKANLQVTLIGRGSNLVNEIGVFNVDDTAGKINGITPGSTEYVKAALERSKVIFSVITNSPNGFNTDNLTRLLEFNSGDNLRFYLIKEVSTDAVKRDDSLLSKVIFSDTSNQNITDLGADGFSLAWKDGNSNNSDEFKDLVVKVQPTNNLLPLGTNLQGIVQGEVIDLRGITQQVKADFVVNREAAFNNFVGFYQVVDENGGINVDGKILLPGESGYAQAAVSERIAGIDLRVDNQTTANFSNKQLTGGGIFAPFIISNGTVEQVLSQQSNQVYFAYLGANPDKVDHIRLLGDNIFGFEDLANGGDQDFNDMIVRVNLSIA